MPRGGRRVGAGRPVGTTLPEKRNRIEQTTAATRGVLRKHTPMDVMAMTMNGYISAAEILGKDIVRVDDRIITQLNLLDKASAIAKDLAPYMHPRLATIEHKGNDDKPIQHHMTVEFVKGRG